MNASIDLNMTKKTLLDTDTWFTVLLVVSAIATGVGYAFTQMI